MKHNNIVGVGILSLVIVITSFYINSWGRQPRQMLNNKSTCILDECLNVDGLNYPVSVLPENVKSALISAIDDEYKAYTVYQKVIEKNGMVRPFSMIIRAEESHITSLKSLFDKYGVTIPENTWAKKITVKPTVNENCQIGVDAEIANANLYKEQLLPIVAEYPDITNVFTNLMNASEQKHLVAFNKCK